MNMKSTSIVLIEHPNVDPGITFNFFLVSVLFITHNHQ